MEHLLQYKNRPDAIDFHPCLLTDLYMIQDKIRSNSGNAGSADYCYQIGAVQCAIRSARSGYKISVAEKSGRFYYDFWPVPTVEMQKEKKR